MTGDLSLLCISYVIRIWSKDFKRWLRLKIWILRLWVLLFKILILKILILRLETGRLRPRKRIWILLRKNFTWLLSWRIWTLVLILPLRSWIMRSRSSESSSITAEAASKISVIITSGRIRVMTTVLEEEPLCGYCVWFFRKSLNWFVKVVFRTSNLFDISFSRLCIVSWLVLNLVKAVTSVSVIEGPILLNASMIESCVLQRLWMDNCFRAKIHKSSTDVFSGCSSNFARSHPGIFLINWHLIWTERASWAERSISARRAVLVKPSLFYSSICCMWINWSNSRRVWIRIGFHCIHFYRDWKNFRRVWFWIKFHILEFEDM